jgi:hypothetical protein
MDPRLAALLREQLLPLQTKVEQHQQMQAQDIGAVISKVDEQYANLRPLHVELTLCRQTSNQQYNAIISKVKEQDINIATAVGAIKQHITISVHNVNTAPPDSSTSASSSMHRANSAMSTIDLSDSLDTLQLAPLDKPIIKESLQEL